VLDAQWQTDCCGGLRYFSCESGSDAALYLNIPHSEFLDLLTDGYGPPHWIYRDIELFDPRTLDTWLYFYEELAEPSTA